MRGGLIGSVLLHAAVLGWALFTIQTQREIRMSEPEPLAVDLVNLSDLTKLRQGARNAKQLEAQPKESPKPDVAKKEAPKPAPVATAPPPPPPPPEPPAVKEEPKPEPPKDPIADKIASAPPEPVPPPPVPVPDPQKKLEEMLKEQERLAEEQKKIEEQKRAEEQRRAEEERKRQEAEDRKREEEKRKKEADARKKREELKKKREAEAKKKEFDAAKISALLNKIPDKGAPRPSVPLDEQAKNLPKGPVLGAPEGRDNQLSASERAVLQQIIRSCVGPKWTVLGGGADSQNLVVKIRVRFNPDGTLAAAPQIMNPENSPFFLAASESAMRAVQQCEPYPLPPAKYDVWKDTVLTLNPRDMF